MLPSPEERRQQIQSRYPTWPRHTLGTHFRHQCQFFADRPYLMTMDRSYTYRDTWNMCWKTAKALIALGVKRRDHVAIWLANTPEYVFLKLAVAMVGAVAIPLNVLLREEEAQFILRQSDSRWLFVQQTVGGNNLENVAVQCLSSLSQEGITIEKAVYLPTTDKEPAPPFISWNHFLELAAQVTDDQLMNRMKQSEYPDEVSDIIYTSGTTGLPKGVLLTHDMFLRCAYSTTLSRAFEDGRRIFTPLPFYHVFAYVEGLLAASFVGGAVIFTPQFNPRDALSLIEKYEANDFLCVPSMLVAVLNHPERENFNLDSLYALMCAAAPAPIPLWERAVKELNLKEICTGYGATEVTASSAHTEVGDPIELIATRVGRIKPAGVAGLPEFGGANVQYKVVDPDTGEELPEGSIGELVVRGNTVTRGYYKNPEETMRTIDKDGWFRTGDLGRMDEQGYIQFFGRSKEMYKVSGENVSQKEVEEVISRHPAVSQVYVVGVPDPLTTETGAAFVELLPGATCTRKEIIQWCQKHLAKFKVPRYVWFMEPGSWPMTGTGKIQKFRLEQLAREKLEKTPASSN